MSKGLAKRLSRLEKPPAPVCNSTKDSHVLDLLKGMLELKPKRETQKPRSVLSGPSHEDDDLRETESSIRMLQKICWYPKGFDLWNFGS
jgi:hypothetical protein